MSYDLMVFRKESAPRDKAAFMKWYEQQTEWREGHSYDDPANTSPELRSWFMEMITTFPALNGPFAIEGVDNSYVSDYCIGKNVIYVGFAWSLVEEAYDTMYTLAEKHGIGFFDTSGSGEIFFPENGKLKAIDNKPWWKLW